MTSTINNRFVSTFHNMFHSGHKNGLASNWRNQPSPDAVPPQEWDHNLTVDAELAEYLLWKYRNTECTLHRMTILPEGAKVFLTRKNNIRNENREHIETMANDMKKGRFIYIADSITFDTNGMMVNSHHRMEACILAGVPYAANISFNLVEESREVSDTGQLKRTAGFVFRSMGVSNYSAAQTICRDVISCIQNESFLRSTVRVTEAEMVAFYRQHSEAIDAAATLAVRLNGIFKVSDVGALFFFLMKARKKGWATTLAEMLFSGRIQSDYPRAMTAFAHRVWKRRLGDKYAMSTDTIRRTLLAVCNMDGMGTHVNSRNPIDTNAVAHLGGTLDNKLPQEIAKRV